MSRKRLFLLISLALWLSNISWWNSSLGK